MHSIALTRNGQLTLPIWFRDKYHLEMGELIELVEVDEGLLLKPLRKVNKRKVIEDLIAFLNAKGDHMPGLSDDEIMNIVSQEIKAARKKDEANH